MQRQPATEAVDAVVTQVDSRPSAVQERQEQAARGPLEEPGNMADHFVFKKSRSAWLTTIFRVFQALADLHDAASAGAPLPDDGAARPGDQGAYINRCKAFFRVVGLQGTTAHC